MPRPQTRLAALALLAAALPLAACGSTSDPLAATITRPGQYELYDCPSIKVAAAGISTRQRQLEELMARADRGPAGGFVSATTYKPEYITLRGKMSQLRRVAAENHCNFVPGEAPAVEMPRSAKKATKKTSRKRRNTM